MTSNSSFVLIQANYRKLQRIVKRKWSKMIFLISNIQIAIPIWEIYKFPKRNFWSQLKMKCSLFLIKRNFRVKKRRRQKLMTLLINEGLFSYEMKKWASFTEMYTYGYYKSIATVIWYLKYALSIFETL